MSKDMAKQFQVREDLIKLLQFVKWNKKNQLVLVQLRINRYLPKLPEYFVGNTDKLFPGPALLHGSCPPI